MASSLYLKDGKEIQSEPRKPKGDPDDSGIGIADMTFWTLPASWAGFHQSQTRRQLA